MAKSLERRVEQLERRLLGTGQVIIVAGETAAHVEAGLERLQAEGVPACVDVMSIVTGVPRAGDR